jgi:hypothetical protein
MIPAPAGEEPEQGRGQPFVPLFSGRRVLVVVFNELRGMGLIRPRRGKAPAGFWRTMTRAGCQCEDMGEGRSTKLTASRQALIRGASSTSQYFVCVKLQD